MQVPDALSRCMNSDASDVISSPEENDPFFPYITEHTGKIYFADPQVLSSETIKINPVDVYSDSGGYDADTEDEFISQAGNDCISKASSIVIADYESPLEIPHFDEMLILNGISVKIGLKCGNDCISNTLISFDNDFCDLSPHCGNDCICQDLISFDKDSVNSGNSKNSIVFDPEFHKVFTCESPKVCDFKDKDLINGIEQF